MEDLTVAFRSGSGYVEAVHGVSFELGTQEVLGLVGESGSGKTATGKAILGLLRGPAARVTGRVEVEGRDLIGLGEDALRQLRGTVVSMVFQDVSASLNPVRRIGALLTEPLRAHLGLGRREARQRAAELLAEVGIPSPRERLEVYPHELSGGMRQRVMIALALACSPRVVIVDEATTSLDVSIQAQILELLRRLAAESQMSMVVISHDLGVIAGLADRMAVMYAGRIVETGATTEMFDSPEHPYTVGLLDCIPSPGRSRLVAIEGTAPEVGTLGPGCPFEPRCPVSLASCAEQRPLLVPPADGRASTWRRVACWNPGVAKRAGAAADDAATPGGAALVARGTDSAVALALRRHDPRVPAVAGQPGLPLLSVRSLVVEFRLGRGHSHVLRAVSGVSFDVARGETLGIVGESGSGKSTVARAVLGLEAQHGGDVIFDGTDLTGLSKAGLRRLRREMQLVMQESDSALNPRLTVGESVVEPLAVHRLAAGADLVACALSQLERVGLPARLATRYPHQLSGGQRQRAIIARALATGPKLVIADEPTSALDVSLRAQIINLLDDLKAAEQLTYVLISHDLSVIRHACDRVAVMYLGRVVEIARTTELVTRPAHPY
ncbi:MAG TPA: ABC transporter ATP-binding protein, partial [Acidimicrobiales bacterium]|nr:ABC transporter ATP-binding protein [Acidimicrobiales bacterium]